MRYILKKDWKYGNTTFQKNTEFTIIMGVVYMDGMLLSQNWQKSIKEAIKNDNGEYFHLSKTEF